MEKELEDIVYSGEDDRLMKFIYKNPQMLSLALRYAIRYDRPLTLNLLLPLAIEEGFGRSKVEIVDKVTSSIISDAISRRDTTTINSMIYNDILNIYLTLRVAAKMGSVSYYEWALSKLEESHLPVDDATWGEMAFSCIGGGTGTNRILSDILRSHSKVIDLLSLSREIVGIQSISKLDIVLSYKRYLDIPHLLIYALEIGFNDGASALLKYIDRESNIDDIVDTAVSVSNVEVLDELIGNYSRDLTSLTLIAIDKNDEDIYSYLVDKVSVSSYPIICMALARQGMLDQLIDLVINIDDYTGVIEELINSGYEDLLPDILDLQPATVSYLPIMYTAYKKGVYEKIRDDLLSHTRYVTPLVEAFDLIIRLGKDSLPQLRKMRIDLSPLKTYVREMGMYDIDRYISAISRYG